VALVVVNYETPPLPVSGLGWLPEWPEKEAIADSLPPGTRVLRMSYWPLELPCLF